MNHTISAGLLIRVRNTMNPQDIIIARTQITGLLSSPVFGLLPDFILIMIETVH